MLLTVACGAPSTDGETCPLTLASDDEHGATIDAAAARLTAASGVAFRVADCGIPVVFEPRVYVDVEVCAVTMAHYNGVPSSIRIAVEPSGSCMPPVETLMHESMHVLLGNGVHASRGLFAAVAEPSASLRGESLDMLCAGLGGCPDRHDELLPPEDAPTVGPLMLPRVEGRP